MGTQFAAPSQQTCRQSVQALQIAQHNQHGLGMNVADKLVGFSRQESIEPVLSAHAFWAHLSSMVALGDYQLTGKSQTQHPQTVVLTSALSGTNLSSGVLRYSGRGSATHTLKLSI